MTAGSKKEHRFLSTSRRGVVAVVVVGFFAATAAAIVTMMMVHNRVQESQRFNAMTVAQSMSNRLQLIEGYLQAMAGFVSINRQVTPAEFNNFASKLDMGRSVKALQYVRPVPQEGLQTYMAEQTVLRGSPFEVKDKTAKIGVEAAGERPIYYPVEHIYPLQGNEAALGLDVASNPPALAALMRALDGAGVAISPSFNLVQNTSERAFSMYLAVRNFGSGAPDPSRGAVAALIGVDRLLSAVNNSQARVVEVREVNSGSVIAERAEHISGVDLIAQQIEFGGTIWQLNVAVEQETSPFAMALLVFGVGALIMLLALGGIDMLQLQAQNRLVGAKLDASRRSLQARETAYKELFYTAATANAEIDVSSQTIGRVNSRAAQFTGYSVEEMVGMQIVNLIHPDDRSMIELALRNSGPSDHGAPQFECRMLHKDGSVLWVLASLGGSSETDTGGLNVCLVMQDITSRKEVEQARDLLVRELAHRLRNTMQLVSSLADQTAKTATSAKDYQSKLQGRLRALNAAQNALFETNWGPVRIDRLARAVLEPFEPVAGERRIEFDVAPITLPAQESQTIALALHELASNAARYGALRQENGRAELKLQVMPGDGDEEQAIQITWAEQAEGMTVERPSTRGFGMVMLEQLMARQYDGTANLEWRPNGLLYQARLPIAKPAEPS